MTSVDVDWLPATKICQRFLQCCHPAADVAENLGMFLAELYGVLKIEQFF